MDLTDDIVEKLLLKGVLTDKSYLVLMDELYDKRWFDDNNLKICFTLIINYYKKYDKVATINTLRVLLQKLKERNSDINISEISELLVESINLNLDLSPQCVEANIINYIKQRGSYYAISDNLDDIEQTRDTSKCIDRLSKFDSIVLHDDTGLNYFEDQDAHWDYLLNPEAKLSFGIPSLDQVTNGGVLSDGRNLIVFMAQPGLGKSLMLSNLAYNFSKMELTTVIISLELSQDIYGKRIDAHISGDNIDTLLATHEQTRRKIDDFHGEYPNSKVIIKEFPPDSINCNSIEVFIDRLVNVGIVPDVILIDYLNLLQPKRRTNEGMYSDIGNVSRELRALTYKYNVPIFTATQSNTGGYNSEDIGLENVSESKGIAHTADFILALYQLEEDRDAGIINGVILKNRLGGYIGKRLPLSIDPHSLRLNDFNGGSTDDGISDILGTPTSDDNEIVVEMDLDEL